MVKRNIIISKAGGNSSGKNYKISLPARMVKELGVTEEDREVFVDIVTTPRYHGSDIGWQNDIGIIITKKGV